MTVSFFAKRCNYQDDLFCFGNSCRFLQNFTEFCLHLIVILWLLNIWTRFSESLQTSCSSDSNGMAWSVFDMSTNMFYLNAEISASASSIIIMWFPPAPQPVLVVNLRDDVTPCETIFVNTCKDNRSEEISSESESTFLWSKKNTLQIKVCSSENGGCFCRTGGWSWSWSWFWS